MSDQNSNNEASQLVASSDLKTKRDEYTEEVMKQNREEKLNNNRDRIIANGNKMEEEPGLPNPKDEENRLLEEFEKQLKNQTFSPKDLQDLVQAAGSEDKLRQLYGLKGLNRVADTNIQLVIDANLVKVLIKLLSNYDYPLLQREAAGVIQIISSGTIQQVEALIDKGIIPCLFELLTCQSEKILEHVFTTLGNFAGKHPMYRDLVLKRHGLSLILETLNKATSSQLIKLGTWAISNFCRGKPLPDINLVEQAIPTLSVMFQREHDFDVLRDSAWALSYLSVTRAVNVLETGIIPKLVYHLDTGDLNLLIPCLKTIGNFFTLPDSQNNITYYGPDFLPKLFKNLQNRRKESVRREVCWLLSNIAASPLSVNSILNDPHYIDIVIGIAKRDVPEVSNEAIWILFNITKYIDKSKVIDVIDLGVLDCFIYHFDAPEVRTIKVALEGILNILNLGQALAKETHNENEALILFINKGGTSKLEKLQAHSDDEIYSKAYEILETFYEEEDDILLTELC